MDRTDMIDQLAASYLEEMSLRDLQRYFLDAQREALASYDAAELEEEFRQVLGG
jgi:hypothetical protein